MSFVQPANKEEENKMLNNSSEKRSVQQDYNILVFTYFVSLMPCWLEGSEGGRIGLDRHH